MENASKALLIAAAVLIVILLIAFGMNIFNQAKGAGDASGAADSIGTGISDSSGKLQGLVPGEAREFNKHFEAYLGSNKNSSECNKVVTIIQEIAGERAVTPKNGDGTNLSATYVSKYSEFTISAKYDKNGFINEIYFIGTKEKTN